MHGVFLQTLLYLERGTVSPYELSSHMLYFAPGLMLLDGHYWLIMHSETTAVAICIHTATLQALQMRQLPLAATCFRSGPLSADTWLQLLQLLPQAQSHRPQQVQEPCRSLRLTVLPRASSSTTKQQQPSQKSIWHDQHQQILHAPLSYSSIK